MPLLVRLKIHYKCLTLLTRNLVGNNSNSSDIKGVFWTFFCNPVVIVANSSSKLVTAIESYVFCDIYVELSALVINLQF